MKYQKTKLKKKYVNFTTGNICIIGLLYFLLKKVYKHTHTHTHAHTYPIRNTPK